ncbi:MAG: hypothetical protein ACK4E0_13910 [Chitinophagaceae bacterium]
MKPVLLMLLLAFTCHFSQAQGGYLFVKKGYKKKRTYTEGDRILLRLPGDTIIGGLITLLKDDTIYLLGKPIPMAKVEAVIVRTKKDQKFHIPVNQLLLITGGVALTTAGLTLSNQAEFNEALTAGLVIGYGPLVVQYLISKLKLGRREFNVRRKFRLQMIDFHLPRRRAF